MDLIIEQDRLKNDELSQIFIIKNSFTPLKPLSNFYITNRRKSMHSGQKTQNLSYDSQKVNVFSSIPPTFKKFIENDWKGKTYLNFKIFSPQKPSLSLDPKPITKPDEMNKPQFLPEIYKKASQSPRSHHKAQFKRTTNNFIAYIPKVSYIQN